MSVLKICGFGILCLASLMCVKNLRENYAPLLRALVGILFVGSAISTAMPVISFFNEAAQKSGLLEYGKLLMRALGIVYLVKVTALVARDCGENGLASGIESIGRIELILLALPLFREILDAVEGMLSW